MKCCALQPALASAFVLMHWDSHLPCPENVGHLANLGKRLNKQGLDELKKSRCVKLWSGALLVQMNAPWNGDDPFTQTTFPDAMHLYKAEFYPELKFGPSDFHMNDQHSNGLCYPICGEVVEKMWSQIVRYGTQIGCVRKPSGFHSIGWDMVDEFAEYLRTRVTKPKERANMLTI